MTKSIDERIKEELERDSQNYDDFFERDSIPGHVVQAFEGGSKRWLWFVSIITTLFGVLTVWLIIEFVGAESTEQQITWGFWAILSTMTMIGFEMWTWMQVSRLAIQRQIKSVEVQLKHSATSEEIEALALAIDRLGAKLKP